METRQMTPFAHLLFLLHYFKINPTFSVVLSFIKIISTIRLGQQKGQQRFCRLPPYSFRSDFKDTHSHISMDSQEIYLSRIFLEFFLKPVYSTLVAEMFQTYSVKNTANTFVNQKIESVHFYSCPQSEPSPRFLS